MWYLDSTVKMGQSFWLYKGWRDCVSQELLFVMSFDAILLSFLFTKLGIVCGWCDCKNWRGCLRSFPASAWELSGTWEQRWLVHLSNSCSYGNNNDDDDVSVVDNNLCLTLMFEFFYLSKYSKWYIIFVIELNPMQNEVQKTFTLIMVSYLLTK